MDGSVHRADLAAKRREAARLAERRRIAEERTERIVATSHEAPPRYRPGSPVVLELLPEEEPDTPAAPEVRLQTASGPHPGGSGVEAAVDRAFALASGGGEDVVVFLGPRVAAGVLAKGFR